MKIASTAALAAVEAPKTSRNSRSHTTWYTSAHAPEPNSSSATRGREAVTSGQVSPLSVVT
jgi:hypothetical protein